jgi:hypothetical protein
LPHHPHDFPLAYFGLTICFRLVRKVAPFKGPIAVDLEILNLELGA